MSSFSPPPSTGKKSAPAVVDLRDGWKFGFDGVQVKTALMETVSRLEDEVYALLRQLECEVGETSVGFVGLLVAIQSDDPGSKARYVRDLANRVVELQEKRDRLARAAKGFSKDMVYLLSEADMKDMGL